MSFTSPLFLGGLVLLFLLYYALPRRAQWPLLLLASLGFYAFAGWQAVLCMLLTLASSYGIAMRIAAMQRRQKACIAAHRDNLTREARKAYNARQKRAQRRWLIAGMLLNFGILAATKVLSLPRLGLDFLVPLGISFYTFRIMGYLIDVFWGKTEAQRNPLKLALFMMFFPEVIQGPISRYGYLSQTLFARHSFDWRSFEGGLQRIIWGYFKKLLIADRLLIAVHSLTAEPQQHSGLLALGAMCIYAAQLYCDFTGGIDIALGIGQCLGIQMEENFLSPFRSKNIVEYWRRWHITMGTWFRDYVFYPVSVSRPLQWATAKCKRRGAKRRLPVYAATLLTWFATGIWHGLAWNFIVWGLLNGVIILVSQELQPLYEGFHKRVPWARGRLYDGFQVTRTFLLMALVRAFDIYENVPLTFRQIGSIAMRPQWHSFFAALTPGDSFGLAWCDWLIAAAGLALLIAAPWFRRETARRPPPIFWAALVLAILIFGVYGLEYDAASFIYTRF